MFVHGFLVKVHQPVGQLCERKMQNCDNCDKGYASSEPIGKNEIDAASESGKLYEHTYEKNHACLPTLVGQFYTQKEERRSRKSGGLAALTRPA